MVRCTLCGMLYTVYEYGHRRSDIRVTTGPEKSRNSSVNFSGPKKS